MKKVENILEVLAIVLLILGLLLVPIVTIGEAMFVDNPKEISHDYFFGK